MNRKDTIYNVASFLLGAHENAYFYDMALEKYRIDNFKRGYAQFSDLYDIDLGQPKGPKYQSGSTWVRDFEKGSVIVNPHTKSAKITT
jgi:hypothetical protein